jgi:hypothetical protein
MQEIEDGVRSVCFSDERIAHYNERTRMIER